MSRVWACPLAPRISATSRRLSMISWRENTMSGNVPPQVVTSQDNIAGAKLRRGVGARLGDHAGGPWWSPLLVQRRNRSGPPGPTQAVIVGQLLRNRGQQAS